MGSGNRSLEVGSVSQIANDNGDLCCGCWQHSGLNAANPGEVVYMEGGDTLVQWRKSFFSQYGVRTG
jgi:hypothetical protein